MLYSSQSSVIVELEGNNKNAECFLCSVNYILTLYEPKVKSELRNYLLNSCISYLVYTSWQVAHGVYFCYFVSVSYLPYTQKSGALKTVVYFAPLRLF